MSVEAWAAVITLGFLILSTLIGLVSSFIWVKFKVVQLEERAKEDRDKNSTQHEDFYDFRRETEPLLAEINQQLTSIISTQERILDEIGRTK